MDEHLLASTLSRWGGMYDVKLWECINEYKSLQLLHQTWKKAPSKVPSALNEKLQISWTDDHFKEQEKLAQDHANRSILYFEDSYPPLLKEIPDPPYILYYQGDITVLQKHKSLSCVGTRAMSQYGKRVIDTLFHGLGGLPLCLISGLALGIDAAVHKAALANNIPTAAVLGAGLDRHEPTSNAQLAKQIIESGGCIISEYPPGVRPAKHHFLARNRIIAGVSSATIVIEGKQHSGSLVTARDALKYGRDVGVVPGDIFSANAQGPLSLLRDGAWPIVTRDDILTIMRFEHVAQEFQSPTAHGLVYATLQTQAASIDGLVEKLQQAPHAIMAELTMLELNGLIGCTATGEYYII